MSEDDDDDDDDNDEMTWTRSIDYTNSSSSSSSSLLSVSYIPLDSRTVEHGESDSERHIFPSHSGGILLPSVFKDVDVL